MTKWMGPLHSAHQIYSSTSSEGGFPAGGVFAAGNCKNGEFGANFRNISAVRSAIAKWTARLDSAHQICLFKL